MKQGCMFSCTVCALNKGITIKGHSALWILQNYFFILITFQQRGMSDFNKNVYIIIIFRQLEINHLEEGMTSSNLDKGAV